MATSVNNTGLFKLVKGLATDRFTVIYFVVHVVFIANELHIFTIGNSGAVALFQLLDGFIFARARNTWPEQ